MIVYLNNKFLPAEDAKISPFDRGFLFADGVYEAMRTYNGKLFRYDDHLARLKRSLNEIQLTYNGLQSIESIIYKLISKNKIDGETFVYLQITRGVSIPRKHEFPHQKPEPTLFITAQKIVESDLNRKNGVEVITDNDNRWMKCNIKSIALLPAVLSKQKSVEAGADEAILIRNGMITEGTHTNFFAVKDETVFTAPESNLILSGITRKVVLELCDKLNIKTKEEFINEGELKQYDEFFITSTIEEVTPVININGMIIKDGKPGKITQKLQKAFYEIKVF